MSAFDENSTDFRSDCDATAGCSNDVFSSHSWQYPDFSTNRSVDDMYSKKYVEPTETLSDCLFADDDCPDVDMDIDVDIENVDPLDIRSQPGGLQELDSLLPSYKYEPGCLKDEIILKSEHESKPNFIGETETVRDYTDMGAETEISGSNFEYCTETREGTDDVANKNVQQESTGDSESENVASEIPLQFPSMFAPRKRSDPTAVFMSAENDANMKRFSRYVKANLFRKILLHVSS